MPRPLIEWFSFLMESKLSRDDASKPHWGGDSPEMLTALMMGEVEEMMVALRTGDAEAIAGECADIANYAMLIADVARGQAGSKNRGRD